MWTISCSSQELSLDKAYDIYRDQEKVLKHGRLLALNGSMPYFMHKTPHEVEVYFSELQNELDFTAALNIFAAGEAAIMVDFAKRGKHGRGWPNNLIERCLRYQFGNGRPRLEDVIKEWMSILKQCYPCLNTLKECEKYRHWLAHGRYYERRDRKKYDPAMIYRFLRDALDCIQELVPGRVVYWKS